MVKTNPSTVSWFRILPLFCIILLIIPASSALGISPGKRIFEYAPGKVDNVKITVYNNDNINFTGFIHVKGELKDHIQVSDKKLEFNKDVNKKTFNYKFTHPQSLSKGNYTSRITIEQVLSENYKGLSNVPSLEVSSILLLQADSSKSNENVSYANVFDYKKTIHYEKKHSGIRNLKDDFQKENTLVNLTRQIGLFPFCFSC